MGVEGSLRIVAPEHFRHAAELRARDAAKDPRVDPFPDSVEVDLRHCAFIRPAAVLWCLVYPLLVRHRSVPCTVLVPHDMGVWVYLKSLGLLAVLSEHGVRVDDRGVRERKDPQVVLGLTKFTDEFAVERLANDAQEALLRSGVGSFSLYPLVGEIFAELALNAVQHAESPVGAFGFIQFYEFEKGRRFVCGVADGGIGIRRSLERNPELAGRFHYDWDAIELAVGERVTGTNDKTRGIGLFGVAQDMRGPGRQLILHSGQGSLEISERVEIRARRVPLFPGTLAYAAIPA